MRRNIVNIMHHLVFCQSDSFLYNEPSAKKLNFGFDKCLEVGSINKMSRTYITASLNAALLSSTFVSIRVSNFNGFFTGSIFCSTTGSATGSVNCVGSTTPGGLCGPTEVIDEFGNMVIEDDGDGVSISLDSEFFPIP